MADELTFDYVIAGGGLCGCVVASRLKQARPDLTVAIIEKGSQEDAQNPNVLNVGAAGRLIGTGLLETYQTTPQEALNGRSVPLFAGNVLGGGSAVNYACWTRGSAADYDAWAKLVGDQRWSYKALLPYFNRSESYHDSTFADQHGYDGPIFTSAGTKGFPLETAMKDAMMDAGLSFNPDMNSGNPNGVAPLVANTHELVRQFSANRYNLKGVTILSNAHIHKLILENGAAAGVQLADGRVVSSRKEVVLSCGALKTPQVLLLSGIGPSEELSRHEIPQVIELPVGRNLHDHPGASLSFTLTHPERGLAVGSPLFNDPRFFEGFPLDWMATAAAPDPMLVAAAAKDGTSFTPSPTSKLTRTDFEIPGMYVAMPLGPAPHHTPDGTRIMLNNICLSTTSRGRVTLQSRDPRTAPAVDPAYLTTEHDRAVLRASLRLALRMAESRAGRAFIAAEAPPVGWPVLTAAAPDAVLDERIAATAWSTFHPAGTASMGAVVDAECRVKGVGRLRVVDASIMPLSITAHLQAPLYAVAELAAEMIIQAA